MKKSTLFGFIVLCIAVLLSGCGGFTGPKTATITGTVLDLDNNPVRDARVWTIDSETVLGGTGPDSRRSRCQKGSLPRENFGICAVESFVFGWHRN